MSPARIFALCVSACAACGCSSPSKGSTFASPTSGSSDDASAGGYGSADAGPDDPSCDSRSVGALRESPPSGACTPGATCVFHTPDTCSTSSPPPLLGSGPDPWSCACLGGGWDCHDEAPATLEVHTCDGVVARDTGPLTSCPKDCSSADAGLCEGALACSCPQPPSVRCPAQGDAGAVYCCT